MMASSRDPAAVLAPRAGSGVMRIAVTVAALAGWVRDLTGWRRRGLALLLGALAALAMPPVHAIPLLFIAFPGLIWLIDGAPRPRAAFAVGWWFGLGHFAIGVYWVTHALLTDPEKFAWMIPFVVGGLAAVLALFPGFAAGVARLAQGSLGGAGSGPARVVMFAAAWTAFEWLRGWIVSGFPWNPLGHVWAFSDAMIQIAALTGVWGLSLVTAVAVGLPAVLADWTRGRAADGPIRRPQWSADLAAVGAGLLLLGALWIGGAVRLAGAEMEAVEDVRLRLVQPGIDPSRKGRADQREAQLAEHLRLTLETPGFGAVSHVVWPETAVPFLLERHPEVRAALAAAVPPDGLLITGALRGAPATGPLTQVWNSMVALDPAAAVVGSFDKFHLVPLGEYVPLRDLFPFLSKITPGSMDFSAGPGPRTLTLPGLPPVSPLICYEVIFPGAVVDREARPDWLLNLTNDAWFGTSFGPHQHFASARMRAVEEGLPLVRAANTGISGVIDPYGRVTARLGLGETGVLDAALPRPTPGITPYGRFGDWSLALLLLVAALVAAVLRRPNARLD